MNDTKVYLVTFKDDKTGKKLVSHGIRNNSLTKVVLPPEPISYFRPVNTDENGTYYSLICDSCSGTGLVEGQHYDDLESCHTCFGSGYFQQV